MKIFEGFGGVRDLGRVVVTVGSFDGVHVGHRALLERVVRLARERRCESVVITFWPHPRMVLGGKIEELTTLKEKISRIKKVGINNLVILPFTEEFGRLTAAEFVSLLVENMDIEVLVAGFNNRLGSDRIGAREVETPFEIEVVDRVGEASSTLIRKLISQGKMDEAKDFL